MNILQSLDKMTPLQTGATVGASVFLYMLLMSYNPYLPPALLFGGTVFLLGYLLKGGDIKDLPSTDKVNYD
jgi:hypothetical protein